MTTHAISHPRLCKVLPEFGVQPRVHEDMLGDRLQSLSYAHVTAKQTQMRRCAVEMRSVPNTGTNGNQDWHEIYTSEGSKVHF